MQIQEKAKTNKYADFDFILQYTTKKRWILMNYSKSWEWYEIMGKCDIYLNSTTNALELRLCWSLFC